MKFTVLLPLTDNDRADQSAVVDRLIIELLVQFGGLTQEGTVTGSWVDGGTVYNDVSRKVSVVCDNSRLDEVRDTIRRVGRELKQLAMYLEIQMDDGVEILRID